MLEEDFSPGDTYGFRDPLLNESGNDRVGQVHVSCTVSFGENDICGGAIRVGGRGKITFYGTVPVTERLNFLLAVTGGTRDFRGARGQMRVESVGDENFRITVQLLL